MSNVQHNLNEISLSHGQARWVMQNFNMLSGESDSTFDAFIKSLRRDGVPFAKDEKGVGAGHNLKYGYEHLMELALALTMRTQGIVSRDMVKLIDTHRTKLRSFFWKAYIEKESRGGELTGLYSGPPVAVENYGKSLKYLKILDENAISFESNESFIHLSNISGWYLDMSLVYSTGGALTLLHFDLVTASQAVIIFMKGHNNLYPRPPIPLTDIAIDIVRLAKSAPQIRRGPHIRG